MSPSRVCGRRVSPRSSWLDWSRLPNAKARTIPRLFRAAANPIGRRVKLADLHDNSDLSRIAHPTQKDHERLARYRAAIEAIQALG